MALPLSPPQRVADTPRGPIAWREAGAGPALVLLHGIGSGADAWAAQFEAFAAQRRVIAWDAPGYGDSAPLAEAAPLAKHYAAALTMLLQQLNVTDLVLVGHSLGALIAAAWAAAAAHAADPAAPTPRLHALVLASPARGYAQASPEVRDAKYRERVDAIQRLGPQGLAAQRAQALCAPATPPAVIERVRANMARITPRGYAQAAHLLAHDDLLTHLHRVKVPIHVLCGDLDRVTLPSDCAAVAQAARAPFALVPRAGHAVYLEQPAAFNAALMDCLGTTEAPDDTSRP